MSNIGHVGRTPPRDDGDKSRGPERGKHNKKGEFKLPEKTHQKEKQKKEEEPLVREDLAGQRVSGKFESSETESTQKIGEVLGPERVAEIRQAVSKMLTEIAIEKHEGIDRITARLTSDEKVPEAFKDAQMSFSPTTAGALSIRFVGGKDPAQQLVLMMEDPAKLQTLSNRLDNLGYNKSVIEVAGTMIELPDPKGTPKIKAAHPAMESSRGDRAPKRTDEDRGGEGGRGGPKR